ncbi:MAG: cysteine synthase A [Firmicutes bacterium]|nr:cysteine synthase A [Bacillota bacterium]
MAIYENILDTIGNTPLVRLKHIEKIYDLKARLYAKIEFFNPGSSVKDRIAYAMINDAENKGILNKESTIIEPTSGNTGIGLAMVGAAKGYKVILVMPDTLSVERRQIMSAFGAKLVLTDGSKGMKGAIEKAEELARETKNSFIPYQFQNPANPKIHYLTTGPEIWNDLQGEISAFVAGVGTGGTISGVGECLKEKNPLIKIVAVEPADSNILSGGLPGPHKIQGIGAGFVPITLNTLIYDEIITINNEDAFKYAKELPKFEGIFTGISAGAALAAAVILAKRNEYTNHNIVVVFPDTGERYLSTTLFKE